MTYDRDIIDKMLAAWRMWDERYPGTKYKEHMFENDYLYLTSELDNSQVVDLVVNRKQYIEKINKMVDI